MKPGWYAVLDDGRIGKTLRGQRLVKVVETTKSLRTGFPVTVQFCLLNGDKFGMNARRASQVLKFCTEVADTPADAFRGAIEQVMKEGRVGDSRNLAEAVIKEAKRSDSMFGKLRDDLIGAAEVVLARDKAEIDDGVFGDLYDG